MTTSQSTSSLLKRAPRSTPHSHRPPPSVDQGSAGRCAVAVIVASTSDIGRWPVSIDDTGRLAIDFLGLTDTDATLTAAGLPRDELTALAELLATARASATQVGGDDAAGQDERWPLVRGAAEQERWADGTDAAGGLLKAESETGTAQPKGHDGDGGSPNAFHETFGEQRNPHGQPKPDEPASAAVNGNGAHSVTQVPDLSLPIQRQPNFTKTASAGGPAHSDPSLDDDLQAWLNQDPTRPRIAILGPVTVEAAGEVPKQRPRFHGEIITYLAVRGSRGATVDQLDHALWPDRTVRASGRRVAVARARRWLGSRPDGSNWLPDMGTDLRYRLADGYLLDWHLFRRLRTRGEARGPLGAGDLRHALDLVRDAPLAGADVPYSSVARNPYVWLAGSEIAPQHILSAVIDTAHHLVQLCLSEGNTAGARRATERAWLADPDRTSDIPWRDLLKIAAADGNDAELAQLVDDLMTTREAEVPEDLDATTYRLLCDLMPEWIRSGVTGSGSPPHVRR